MFSIAVRITREGNDLISTLKNMGLFRWCAK